MKKFVRFACLIGVLVPLLWGRPVSAQVTVTASVDRPSVPMNQTLNFTIEIVGAANAPQPALPAIDGLQIGGSSRSSQISIVNGQTTIQNAFVYTLQPTREGPVTIPAVTVVVDGNTYTTEPVAVTVTAASNAGANTGSSTSNSSGATNNNSPAGSLPNATEGNQVFIEAEVDNATPYLGEQITYIFRFYQAVNLFGQPQYDSPSFTGFWDQEETSQSQGNTQIDQIPYRVTELRTILFPTIVGQQSIEPAQLSIPGRMFQADVTLQTNAVNVDVQTLPDPAPANFTGAVGQLSLELTAQTEAGGEADSNVGHAESPLRIQLDESVTLRVILEGAGNFGTMGDITLPDAPEWRTFESTSATDSRVANGQLIGRRTVEQLIVPTRPGSYTIPPAEFAYFDPEKDQYQTLTTEAIYVTVEGELDEAANAQPAPLADINGQQSAVERIDADIRHIKDVPSTLGREGSPVTQRPLFWALWLIPLLMIGAEWFMQRRQRALSADPTGISRSRALKDAVQQIKETRTQALDPYGSSRGIITDYLSKKFDLPVAGLTQRDLGQALANHGIDAQLIEQTQELLALSDLNQYAPTSKDEQSGDLLSNVEALLRELERAIESSNNGNQINAKSAFTSMMLLPLVGMAVSGLLLFSGTHHELQAASPAAPPAAQSHEGLHQESQSLQARMAQANQRYEDGEFAEAALIYQDLLGEGLQNGAVFFNLGNAYFKQGDIGKAILNYERATRFIPRDGDLQANLNLAQSLAEDRYDAQRESMLGQLAQLAAGWLTLGELAVAGLVLWFLAAVLWVIFRQLSIRQGNRHTATFTPLIVVLLLLILVVGLWSVRSYTEQTRSQAIILVSAIDVLSGPGDQYITEFTLHSGAKVSLLERRGQWHRLSLPGDELQGWVPQEAIGVIGDY